MADVVGIGKARSTALPRQVCAAHATAKPSASLSLTALLSLSAWLSVIALLPAVAMAGDGVLHAQLRDPMQPPADTAVANAASTADGTGHESRPREDTLPQLSSIRRTAMSSPRAQLDGQWLTEGQRIRQWRVRSIAADTVLLQSIDNPREQHLLAVHSISIRPARTTP